MQSRNRFKRIAFDFTVRVMFLSGKSLDYSAIGFTMADPESGIHMLGTTSDLELQWPQILINNWSSHSI